MVESLTLGILYGRQSTRPRLNSLELVRVYFRVSASVGVGITARVRVRIRVRFRVT